MSSDDPRWLAKPASLELEGAKARPQQSTAACARAIFGLGWPGVVAQLTEFAPPLVMISQLGTLDPEYAENRPATN